MEHWSSFQRSFGEIIWPSFMAACLATALFFSQVDPALFLQSVSYPIILSDTAVYSLGFFFFWFICILASSSTLWLVRTERRITEFPASDDHDR